MKKLDLKRRFLEYKKDLSKLEQNARFQLFNLKKERIIGNEINMKGKINSTNTFFDLAFIKGDYWVRYYYFISLLYIVFNIFIYVL